MDDGGVAMAVEHYEQLLAYLQAPGPRKHEVLCGLSRHWHVPRDAPEARMFCKSDVHQILYPGQRRVGGLWCASEPGKIPRTAAGASEAAEIAREMVRQLTGRPFRDPERGEVTVWTQHLYADVVEKAARTAVSRSAVSSVRDFYQWWCYRVRARFATREGIERASEERS